MTRLHAKLCLITCIGLAAATAAPAAAPASRPVSIIYGTDLLHPHDDPDDHWDLATLYALPNVEVKAILLDLGERQKERSGRLPVEQMFRLTGRKAPYSSGLAARLASPTDDGRSQPVETQGSVELLLKALREAREPVTIVTTGSLRDVCAAYNREGDLLRAKVARLYINMGSAEKSPEWNVTLDQAAFLGIMGSGLPVYFCPCMPANGHRHSTYWKFRQAEVFERLPRGLLNFFIYALQQVRPGEIEPLAALDMDLRPWRHLPAAGERNMWCTASLLHAAGLRAPTAAGRDSFSFTRVRVDLTPEGHTASIHPDPAGPIQIFTAPDHAAYQKAMLESMTRLLTSFPAPPPKP